MVCRNAKFCVSTSRTIKTILAGVVFLLFGICFFGRGSIAFHRLPNVRRPYGTWEPRRGDGILDCYEIYYEIYYEIQCNLQCNYLRNFFSNF